MDLALRDRLDRYEDALVTRSGPSKDLAAPP